MKKSAMAYATKSDLEKLRKHLDSSTDFIRTDLKDYSDVRLLQTEKKIEKKITENLEQALGTHQQALLEAISEVIINDRIKPLELRVGILETKKI